MLFDWLVVGHILNTNPAYAVRGPKYSQKNGKTPVLNHEEARALLAAINTDSLTGLRDGALIGVMVYTFARIGAVLQMRVGDYFSQGRRGWVRLHEKGGKEHRTLDRHTAPNDAPTPKTTATRAQRPKGFPLPPVDPPRSPRSCSHPAKPRCRSGDHCPEPGR